MVPIVRDWFISLGAGEGLAGALGWAAGALAMLLGAVLANYVAKKILLAGISRFVRKTRTRWDDALLKRKVFTRLSHLAPALVIYACAQFFGSAQDILERLSVVYMILVGLLSLSAFLNAIDDIYRTYEISRHKPIKGYIQVAMIIIVVFVGIIIISVLMNQSPWLLLSGVGAMTAVLLLVFKDSILGLVASVQLTTNDMVRIGDWIEMPKFGADGDVIDISLHTVKVQNWDKTISTIPAYALISDSFKNWRGMEQSGGRRIKRAIYIDTGSVAFCTKEMLDSFEKFQLITDYIRQKRREIAEYNKEHGVDTSVLVNGRNLTNVGTFRAYIIAYLKSHPMVRQDMTFLVRQLQPGEYGLPIEIYVFSKDQRWANYEAIQADIFDHVLAVVPQFDLRVFQYPTGADFHGLSGVEGLKS